jgi:SAM-dependent methyltransferase|tara:strand:+ start:123 stop:881 length:759 start_codon:yes stop_codon:yes gene_type:complete
MTFRNDEERHEHSLKTLNTLFEYDDFMESIGTLVDLGCGSGLDLEWWATRTTRDDVPIPLNIRCTGVDIAKAPSIFKKYSNITHQLFDFEKINELPTKTKFDILWCHDAFQYCVTPLETLAKWNTIAEDGGMLIMAVPQTTNMDIRQLSFVQPSGCFYHHTVVSLMHMLAVNGWDCNSGFFLKRPDDDFIHVIAYKSIHAPMDPKTTTWYDLVKKDLLPETAVASVQRHGMVRQQDLVLHWIDKSLYRLGEQ